MQDKLLKLVNEKLDVVIRLHSLQIVNGLSQTDAIKVLGKSGMERKVIAEILGTKVNVVNARLSEVNRKKGKGNASKK